VAIGDSGGGGVGGQLSVVVVSLGALSIINFGQRVRAGEIGGMGLVLDRLSGAAWDGGVAAAPSERPSGDGWNAILHLPSRRVPHMATSRFFRRVSQMPLLLFG
jgi:hypothetical protein